MRREMFELNDANARFPDDVVVEPVNSSEPRGLSIHVPFKTRVMR